MPDDEFDQRLKRIRPTMTTGNLVMDIFFATVFTPETGMWIRRHPDLEGIRRIVARYHP